MCTAVTAKRRRRQARASKNFKRPAPVVGKALKPKSTVG